ncbi:DUF3515 domain-containing protein [Allosalinactinospora lopnorensis]|uniref:DUF3515 domain-containing protein n=1 Tax=Allosalinactinospora lopnorensis TaxID=1352348 RepID=UPI000623C4B3|nr:DUF3515 domain-containing protein [Allosalinactinospora lopnorensis]
MRRSAIGGLLAGVTLMAGCTATDVQVPEPTPGEQAAELCRTLVDDVPRTLFGEAEVSEPGSDLVAAWGDPVIALRCGVDRPDALRPDSELMVVNDVAWLPEPPDEPNLYTAVGHEAYVEMSIPPAYGAPAEGLVEISDLINENIPALPGGKL